MCDKICNDLTVLNQWHPITSTDNILSTDINETILLAEPLLYKKIGTSRFLVWKKNDSKDKSLPALCA